MVAVHIRVKNTFVDVTAGGPRHNAKPRSRSCPAEILRGTGTTSAGALTSVARTFSSDTVTRAAREVTGHLHPGDVAAPPAKQPESDGLSTASGNSPLTETLGSSCGSEAGTEYDWPQCPMTLPPLPNQAGNAGALSGSAAFAVLPAPCVAPPVVWFRVAYRGGVQLRAAPCIDAAPTGVTLAFNAVFPVTGELRSADGRVYLRLADGSGWAIDDTALCPEEPSVVRGHWAAGQGGPRMPTVVPGRALQLSAHPRSPVASTLSAVTTWEQLEHNREEPYSPGQRRRRRRRGGLRRRPKHFQNCSEGSESEADEALEDGSAPLVVVPAVRLPAA